MRKVTQQIAEAFRDGKKRAVGNSMTDGERVYLHGNLIAKRRGNALSVTLAGWNTPTTRERINGILEVMGVPHKVRQHNFEPCVYDSVSNKPVYFDKHAWLDFTIT